MYFADLTPYAYRHSLALPEVLNVGWLDDQHPYTQGHVPKDLVEKLAAASPRLRTHPTQGVHACPFCARIHGEHVPIDAMGSAELWLRAPSGQIYASPELVVHYIRAHEYRPPIDWLAACDLDDPAWDPQQTPKELHWPPMER